MLVTNQFSFTTMFSEILFFKFFLHHGLCGKGFNGFVLYDVVYLLLRIYSFIKEKSFKKTLRKKVKLLKISNFTYFHNVFYVICILKSFDNNISVVVCSFFQFGAVSEWCIRERVKYADRNICY